MKKHKTEKAGSGKQAVKKEAKAKSKEFEVKQTMIVCGKIGEKLKEVMALETSVSGKSENLKKEKERLEGARLELYALNVSLGEIREGRYQSEMDFQAAAEKEEAIKRGKFLMDEKAVNEPVGDFLSKKCGEQKAFKRDALRKAVFGEGQQDGMEAEKTDDLIVYLLDLKAIEAAGSDRFVAVNVLTDALDVLAEQDTKENRAAIAAAEGALESVEFSRKVMEFTNGQHANSKAFKADAFRKAIFGNGQDIGNEAQIATGLLLLLERKDVLTKCGIGTGKYEVKRFVGISEAVACGAKPETPDPGK